MERKKLSIGATTHLLTDVVNNTGSWRTVKPIIEKGKCKTCGICEKQCPEGGIAMGMAEKERFIDIDYNFCKGCMVCSTVCPTGAITSVKEDQNHISEKIEGRDVNKKNRGEKK